MKSKTTRFFSLGIASVASVLFGFSVPEVQAQVNERKALRDASGVYRGGTQGGKYAVSYDDGAPGFTYDAKSSTGRARVPVKTGRTKTGMRHPDIPSDAGWDDNGRAVGNARQKPRVTRGGGRIVTRASGATVKVDDDPRRGDWKRGKGSATIDKRGKRWNAKASKISAAQRNTRVDGTPPDHTKRLSGLGLKGRG